MSEKENKETPEVIANGNVVAGGLAIEPAPEATFVEPINVKISRQEWFDLARSLECHHAVFYKLWDMGKPIFTNQIDTAAVSFDKHGKLVMFMFNPKFWEKLDLYNKQFVICHEALHVILNHGARFRDATDKQAGNVAMDVVVNHLLCRSFGFERDKIIGQENLCWIDTVFKGEKYEGKAPPDDEMFEYYYNLFDKYTILVKGGKRGKDGKNGMGGMPNGVLDDHSFLEEDEDFDEVIDKLNEELSDEEKESLKDVIDKHFQADQNKDENHKPSKAGTGTGAWTFVNAKVKKKRKWETVIKNWSKKYCKPKDKDVEQWARISRRLALLPSTMFLPSDMEVDDEDFEKGKIDVHFFLDTSGSCWNLKDRFFEAALSLPTDRFNVRLFCFDTAVQETTLESRKVYGGGGTAFDIIETHIQSIAAKDKYPEAVFVITDAMGNRVQPQFPKKWYWFITQLNSYRSYARNYIPEECHLFNLEDYE